MSIIGFAAILLVVGSQTQLAIGAVSSSNCCADMPGIISGLEAEIAALKSDVANLKGGSCPLGYVYLKDVGKCYRLNTDAQTWEQGQATCAASKGNLAKINSQQETDAIFAYLGTIGAALKTNCGQIFIGIQRTDPNSCATPFVWKTAAGVFSTPTYTNWNTGEPNCSSGGIEKCGTMYDDTGRWNDLSCNSKICSLCQA